MVPFLSHLLPQITELLTTTLGEDFRSFRYLIAVSGGGDSMVLLDLAHQIFPKGQLAVAHFNHRLRGEESDRDEALVQAAAAHGAIAFYRSERQLNSASEASLRKERLGFLRQTAEKLGYDFILTAHHANDQIETVMMRLLRGTGIDGLRGIPVRNHKFIRPLIDILRTDIEAYAKTRGISYREDATNQDPKYFRNRIRAELIPVLTKLAAEFGGERAFLRRFGELTTEVHWACETLKSQDRKALAKTLVRTPLWLRLSSAAFFNCVPERRNRWVRQIFLELGEDPPTRVQLNELMSGMQKRSKTITAPGKVTIRYSCSYFFFQNEAQKRLTSQTPNWELKAGRLFCKTLDASLPVTTLAPDEEFRFFRDGDRFQGTKLKRIFLERKIPWPERRIIPLVAKKNSQEVDWYFPLTHQRIVLEQLGFPFSFQS